MQCAEYRESTGAAYPSVCNKEEAQCQVADAAGLSIMTVFSTCPGTVLYAWLCCVVTSSLNS